MAEKTATNLEEAKAHFAESSDPITCTKEGKDDADVTSVEEAEAFYAE